jgi:predicted dienelactone hydrolase
MWLVAATVLTGCEDPCLRPGPADECHDVDPGKPGPFPVGVTTIEVVGERAGRQRRLVTEIWYPAMPEAAGLPRDSYDLIGSVPEDLAGPVAGVYEPPMVQDAARDAPIDHRYAPYPLLTFSHGKGGIRYQTFSLMVHLASHGYVVAAPDHTGDTVWDLIRRQGEEASSTIQSLVDRPKDLALVAEVVSDSRGPLGATVDMDRWGVLGHSFGGVVSIAIAAAGSEFFDARVKASLPLAPAVRIIDLLGAGPSRSTVPMLNLSGMVDDTLDYETEQIFGFETGKPPKGLVGIRRAGHFSFTETCVIDLEAIAALYDIDAGNLLTDGCGPAFIEPQSQRRIQNYFAAAFFNRFLRGSGAASEYMNADSIPADFARQIEYYEDGLSR